MDPITLGIGAAASIIGGIGSFEAGKAINSDEQQVFQLQKQVNAQRQQQMELSARRQQMENFRNTQRARATAINNSVSGGSNFGSGLQGGLGQLSAAGDTANLGVNQNLEIGNNIFGLDNQITNFKSDESNQKSNQAMWQSVSSLGNSAMSNAGTIGKVGSYFGGSALSGVQGMNLGQSLFGGGSPSGY